MFAQQHTTTSRSRVLKLALVVVAVVASTMAISVPSASAQTISSVSPVCADGGAVVIDPVFGQLRCAVSANAGASGEPSRCPAGTRSAAEIGTDESRFIGAGADFSEGTCYYDTSCPAGFRSTGLVTDGPEGPGPFTEECVPTGAYRPVTEAEYCVAADGVEAQWFPPYRCAVVKTPPVLEPGVSTAAQDCTAAGGSFDSREGSCLYAVFSDSLPPEPTIDPNRPQPTAIPIGTGPPTPVIDPPLNVHTAADVAPICNDGVPVIDESADVLYCARPASLPGPDGPIPCPAPSKPASELMIDEANVVGENALFSEGSCYYEPVCPEGYWLSQILSTGDADGVFRVTTCAPSDPAYRTVASAAACRTAGWGAQWFADSQTCGVPVTPDVLLDGVSTAEQDCFAAGGRLIPEGQCVRAVYEKNVDATPEATPPPPVASATPTPVIDPPKPTATPVVPIAKHTPTPAPATATPAPVKPTTAPVKPTPAPVKPTTAPVKPTPTPKHPGFGFTG